MTGALSALIFAINGCIEVFFAQGQQSSHLVLLLLLQMVLAGWALAESALVHMPENPAPLRRLRLVLAAQLAMECVRGILLVSLTPAQMGGTFASRLLDPGVGLLFMALYFIAFLAVNRALIKLYSSNERRVHDRLRLAEADKMQLAMASEKRLAALKAQLEDAIGSMSQGIVMVASDGRVVLSNAQVNEILELPQGVLGHQQPFAQMLQFESLRGDMDLDSNDLESRLSDTGIAPDSRARKIVKTHSGRHVEVNSRQMSSGHTVHTYADVTSYALANAQLRAAMDSLMLTQEQLSAQMQRARQESDMKLRFVTAVSHELRTPLNGIVGLVDVIARSGLTEQQAELIADVETSTRQLHQLTNDILDLSRLQDATFSLVLAPFDLAEAVDKTVRAARGAAQAKALSLELLMGDAPGAVIGDAQRLQQILNNLIYNAIKFTAEGWVRIHVECKPAGNSTEYLEVVISVADSGRGIAPEALGHIFEPLRQGDESINRDFGGTGLGLALCRELSESMGGDIRVSSRLGHGSVFTVVAMLKTAAHDAVPPDEPSQAADVNAVRLDGTRILVVDDNRINRKLLSIWLGEAGAEVHMATDGAEGLRAATSERFDAILMDVSMPVMNGLEATRAIRLLASSSDDQQRLRAMVPLIGVTAMAGPEERRRCLEAGMDAHLSKPLSRSKLLRTLADLMATHAWLRNDDPGPGRPSASIPLS
jgi:signal transduction histidine kinase/AmiR/NasT family two-component response regulator